MVCSFILGVSGRDSGMAQWAAARRAFFSGTGTLHFSRVRVFLFVFLMIGNETRDVCKIWAGCVLIRESYDQMKFLIAVSSSNMRNFRIFDEETAIKNCIC